MSLTQADLKAIQRIIQVTVQPMIDRLDETLSIQTASGFAEVHEKIDKVEAKLESKIDKLSNRFDIQEDKLNNTIERVDSFETKLKRLKPKAV